MTSSESADHSGKAFEKRVVDLYRGLGYQVTHNAQMLGKQTDLIARKEMSGGPTMTLVIECKDWAEPVGNEDVNAFISRINAQRSGSNINGGVVVGKSGFTAPAKAAAAASQDVELISFEDLSAQVLDVRNQIRERIAAYEDSDIYHNYLPLEIEVLDWESLTPKAEPHPSIQDLLVRWMSTNEPGLDSIFVVADFGAGKTTLLEHLEHDRAVAHLANEDSRIPLFVPLREYRNSQDIGTLLRASFRDSYYRDLPTDFLWSRINGGHFYVLLDAFDEMVERSDPTRRLELFHELLPVLRSKCPTILTSRPSYFVELGELDHLLATLREHEAAVAGDRTPGLGAIPEPVDRLVRQLVDRHREVRPQPGANSRLNPRSVALARLKPLDSDQIEEFLDARKEELESVGASTEGVMRFIERTYDLTDLASRPMLLDLIISSVLVGGLDLDDTERQFGASGLYEAYTEAKLRHDFGKGMTRQGGLSMEARRQFAEHLALRMYEASTLEYDFVAMLDDLLGKGGPMADLIESSGLGLKEIATDFATCSFATLDQDVKCRFIHKSFRGFFVARVLKDRLGSPRHPLLSEPLEREVLYFLGGFAPTEPTVGEQLWAQFTNADKEKATFRRNMLVAFLYTTPLHDTRLVADAEIANAEFGRLTFERSRFRNVVWKKCTVMELALEDVKWRQVRMVDSHVADLRLSGEVEAQMTDTIVESLHAERVNAALSLIDSSVDALTIEASSVRIASNQSRIGGLAVSGGTVSCEADQVGLLENVDLVDTSFVAGDNEIGSLRALRSAITASGGICDSIAGWPLRECAVTLSTAQGPPKSSPAREEEGPDSSSVILCPAGISPELLTTVPSGVFGMLPQRVGESRLRQLPSAWGVLTADAMLGRTPVSETNKNGYRWGDILLVTENWYQRAIGPSGPLSTVSLLEGFAAVWEPVSTADAFGIRLAEILTSIRAQFDVLNRETWPPLR